MTTWRSLLATATERLGSAQEARWLVERAYPVKWTGTDLDGNSGQVLFESVELVHHGIRKG